MKNTIAFLLLILICSSVFADDHCDCTTFPFKPAGCFEQCACGCMSYPFEQTGCFQQCVHLFITAQRNDLAQVKHLDPGVALSIRILKKSPNRETLNFDALIDKDALESKANDEIVQSHVIVSPQIPPTTWDTAPVPQF